MAQYQIKQGDTLSEIAEANGIPVEALAELNGIKDVNKINAGSVIRLPDETITATTTPSSKPTYTAPQYKESASVQLANQQLLTHIYNNKPGEYTSQWQTQLNDTIDKILNREKFSYDLNGDALYQQYKDKYIQQGKMAMGDAIGQASAMTGGYGNSYAQSVGQQAYQAQLQNLNDIVPELYQMALDQYNVEGQDLYNQYAMLGSLDDRDYGRHRDEVADYLTERDYLTGRYDSEKNFDYSKYIDNRDFGYEQYRDSVSDDQWQTSLDYQKERDKVDDEQWEKEYDLAASKVNTTGDNPNTTGTPKMTTEDYEYWSDAFSNVTSEAKAKALRDQMAIAVGDKTMAYELYYQWEQAFNANKEKVQKYNTIVGPAKVKTDMIN